MKKRAILTIAIVSFTLNLVFLCGLLMIVRTNGGLPWLGRQLAEVFQPNDTETVRGNYQDHRLSVFYRLSVEPGDIVLLGDSILDIGEWQELLDDHRAKNRAILGDDTRSLLNRLGPVLAGRPRHIVLMCGINNFQKGMPYGQTTTEYAGIVATVTSQSPGTDIWLLPVLPVNRALYRKRVAPYNPRLTMPPQQEVQALNAFIRRLASDNPRIHFVDLPELLDATGQLQAAYTLDGLHLNGRGLELLAARLKNLLRDRQSRG